MFSKQICSTIVVILALTALAGCGENAQQAVCQGLGTLAGGVEQLAAVPAEATAGDVKELISTADTPIEAVRTANRGLNSSAITDLLTAYDELTASVAALPDDAPLAGEAADQFQGAVTKVQGALAQATGTLNCAP